MAEFECGIGIAIHEDLLDRHRDWSMVLDEFTQASYRITRRLARSALAEAHAAVFEVREVMAIDAHDAIARDA